MYSSHRKFIRDRRLIFAWCVTLVLCFLPNGNARAQETLRIAAVVNEEIISAFDLQARLKLVITMSQLPRTDETFKSLAPATLRTLIDEKLKFQEAKNLGISVSQDELDGAISLIEQRNGLTPNTLIDMLEKNSVDPETLFDQLRSEIVWSRIIGRKYRNNVIISDEDIDTAMMAEEEARNQPRYHISEIIIPVDSPDLLAQASEQISNLSAQIRAGADFSALARSFSQSSSAVKGGDAGWLRLDQIPSEVRPAVTALQPGQVTLPIRITAGFALIKLNDIQSGAATQKPDTFLKLSQLHLPLPQDAAQSTVSSYMESARKSTESAQGCEAFESAAGKIGSPLSGSLGDVLLSKLPPALQEAVRSLPVGKAGAPIRSPDAVIVLMVCERKDRAAPDTTIKREEVQLRLLSERLVVYARQEIRDLRRAAYIEIR